MKVAVTGASGLLGRQVVREAERRGHTVVGTALSRAQPPQLVKLDLNDATAVEAFFASEQPQAIIHCAAEKRPDVAEQNQAATEQLNAVVPGLLAQIAKDLGAFFAYVSTDYVFDGTAPPYEVGDTPNPLNFYGRTKLAGEQAVQRANPEAAILRVPVLYGPTEYAAESAVNVLVDAVKNTAASAKMDAWQARFPTCTEDVARVLVDLGEISVGAVGEGVAGVFHFSASEQMTKYDMCQVFARLLGMPDSLHHIAPITEKPAAEQMASRPDNTQLSTAALEEIGVNITCVPFEQWWAGYLNSKTTIKLDLLF